MSNALMQMFLSSMLLVVAGAAQASTTISPRNNNERTTAGVTLASILGGVFGGLIIAFTIFGIWLWRRIKKQRRLDAEAGEGRASADTVVEGRDNELRDFGRPEEGVKENGMDKRDMETTQTAV